MFLLVLITVLCSIVAFSNVIAKPVSMRAKNIVRFIQLLSLTKLSGDTVRKNGLRLSNIYFYR